LIVNKGVNFATAVFFALAPARFGRYVPTLLNIRNRCVRVFGNLYLGIEDLIGKFLSLMTTPKILRKKHYFEIVLVQYANRDKNNIEHFENTTVSEKLNQLETINHIQIGLTAINTFSNTVIKFNVSFSFCLFANIPCVETAGKTSIIRFFS
jgi:hypothetical protein